MAKSLLYRLFKIGKIPAALSAELLAEGIMQQDEGISGTITYKNFRSPRRYSTWRRVWFTGSLTLTPHRLVALMYSRPLMDVQLDDQRLHQINISVENGDRLTIAFDANLFQPDWHGQMEYRFRTPDAQVFADAISAK